MGDMLNPKMPKAQKPVRVPNPDDPDIRAAAMTTRQEEEARRRGRRATDLGGGSGAGGAYSRTTLG